MYCFTAGVQVTDVDGLDWTYSRRLGKRVGTAVAHDRLVRTE
jgi:hypothetical protein